MHVRVCVECGEEYRPEIARCADCGGDLEDRHLGDDDAPAAAPAEPEWQPRPVPPGHRALFHASAARELPPVTERLHEAGIEFHLHPENRAGHVRFDVYVAEADAAEALRALAPVIHGGSEDLSAIERGFDVRSGYAACPACDAALRPGLVECPECGLAVGAADPECPACGGALEGDGTCARCSES